MLLAISGDLHFAESIQLLFPKHSITQQISIMSQFYRHGSKGGKASFFKDKSSCVLCLSLVCYAAGHATSSWVLAIRCFYSKLFVIPPFSEGKGLVHGCNVYKMLKLLKHSFCCLLSNLQLGNSKICLN